eukprot:g2774.t1
MDSLRVFIGDAKVFIRYQLEQYRIQRNIRKKHNEEKKKSNELGWKLRNQYADGTGRSRVLFLGTRESGVRTIFKQFNTIYDVVGDDEKEANLKLWRHCIHATIVHYVIVFIRNARRRKRRKIWTEILERERLRCKRNMEEDKMTEEENMIDVKSVVKIKGHDVTRDYVVSGEGVSGKSRKVSEITEKDTSTVVTKSSKLRGKDGQYITPTVASSTNSNDTSVNIERLDNMSDQEVDIKTEWNAHRAEERLESDFGIAYDDEDDVLGFASEHSNAIRMILGVADKVDDEHKRLEHLFTSLERLCRGKDERNAEERRREEAWRRGLRKKFLNEERSASVFGILKPIVRKPQFDRDFKKFKERETSKFYKERAERVRRERRQKKKRTRRVDNAIGAGLDADDAIFSTSEEEDEEKEDDDDASDSALDDDEDDENEGDVGSVGYLEELQSIIKRMNRVPPILALICASRVKGGETSSVKLGDVIQSLWKSQAVRDTFADRVRAGEIPVGIAQMLDVVGDLCADDWIPSLRQKLIGKRMYRVGIHLRRLRISGYPFEMILPFQRTPQTCDSALTRLSASTFENDIASMRKWIFQFCDVDAVIYVVPLSAYDEICDAETDPYTSGLQRSLALFRHLCALTFMKPVFKIVIFNKMDEFEKKIKVSGLRDRKLMRFCDYEGEDAPKLALAYVRNLFAKEAGDRFFDQYCSALDDSSLRQVLVNIGKEISKVRARDRALMRKQQLKLKEESSDEYDTSSEEEGASVVKATR